MNSIANVQKFGDVDTDKPKRGRPHKNYEKKIVGSLIPENSTCKAESDVRKKALSALRAYDAWTVEVVYVCHISHLENELAEWVKRLRYIIDKKARAFPNLDLSGVWMKRGYDYAPNSIVDFRVICTNFPCAVFIASNLATYLEHSFKGLNFELEVPDINKRKLNSNMGHFDMLNEGFWNSEKGFENTVELVAEPFHRDFKLTEKHYYRVMYSAKRAFNFSRLMCGPENKLQLIKGALDYCCDADDIRHDNKTIYQSGGRSFQTFGKFYNSKLRREEYHSEQFTNTGWYGY